MATRGKKNAGKAPAFLFYYKDWLADQRLRRASFRAKGVWIDLVAVSCDMPIPGLFVDGHDMKKTLDRPLIDHLLTGNPREKRMGIDELIKLGILKRNQDGVFYVKRVYEDMKLRRIRQEAGKKGGNPNLVGNLVKQNDKQKPTPSVSVSVASINPPYPPAKGDDICCQASSASGGPPAFGPCAWKPTCDWGCGDEIEHAFRGWLWPRYWRRRSHPEEYGPTLALVRKLGATNDDMAVWSYPLEWQPRRRGWTKQTGSRAMTLAKWITRREYEDKDNEPVRGDMDWLPSEDDVD